MQANKWSHVFQHENVVHLISKYYDLQSLARFARVSRRSFPLPIPPYLSTSAELGRMNGSIVLCQSPTYTLRCYYSLGDEELVRALENNDLRAAEQGLLRYGGTLSSSCIQYALQRVSSEFDCCSFFKRHEARLNVHVCRLIFSRVTDKYFPLEMKQSALRYILQRKLVNRRIPKALNQQTMEQLLLISTLDFLESADQAIVFELLCHGHALDHNEADVEFVDNLQRILTKIEPPLLVETCQDSVSLFGLGMSRPVLELLVPIATSLEPLSILVNLDLSNATAKMMQVETYNFFLRFLRRF